HRTCCRAALPGGRDGGDSPTTALEARTCREKGRAEEKQAQVERGGHCRELLAHDLRRFDHGHALLDAFLDRPGLQPTVRVRPELLRREVAEPLAYALRGLVDGFRRVRVHVDDPDGELLRERVSFEEVEPPIS